MSLLSAASLSCSACLDQLSAMVPLLQPPPEPARTRIVACKADMPSNSWSNSLLQPIASFAEHSHLHSTYLAFLAAIPPLLCSMPEDSTVLKESCPPPRLAHSLAAGDWQALVSTLTSCVSLPYSILPSFLLVLLSDVVFDALSPRLFPHLLFLLCTRTPPLDSLLYPLYQ